MSKPGNIDKLSNLSLPNATVVTKKIYDTMNSDNGAALADVTLASSDKVHIPAVRALLSMSSSYFKKLFSSDFAEKKQSKVSVSIQSSILREVLEFIYTDDCNLIRTVRIKLQSAEMVKCKDVQALVQLADCADYTRVERLISRCEEAVNGVIRKSPHVACVTVRALAKGRLSWGKKLVKEAAKSALAHMKEALLLAYDGCDLKCGLAHLDDQAAEDLFSMVKPEKKEPQKKEEGSQQEKTKVVVKGTGVIAKDFDQGGLFQALIAWATGGTALLLQWKRPSWTNSEIFVDTESMKVMESRLKSAKRIASWFEVSDFMPGFLTNIVEGSGLLDTEVLLKAYKKQSTQLEELAKANADNISAKTKQIAELNTKLSRVPSHYR